SAVGGAAHALSVGMRSRARHGDHHRARSARPCRHRPTPIDRRPTAMMDLTRLVRTIPDYPKPGIQFRDITTLLADGAGFREVIRRFADRYASLGVEKVA